MSDSETPQSNVAVPVKEISLSGGYTVEIYEKSSSPLMLRKEIADLKVEDFEAVLCSDLSGTVFTLDNDRFFAVLNCRSIFEDLINLCQEAVESEPEKFPGKKAVATD